MLSAMNGDLLQLPPIPRKVAHECSTYSRDPERNIPWTEDQVPALDKASSMHEKYSDKEPRGNICVLFGVHNIMSIHYLLLLCLPREFCGRRLRVGALALSSKATCGSNACLRLWSGVRISRSISRMSLVCVGVANEIALPSRPARPVRPMRST